MSTIIFYFGALLMTEVPLFIECINLLLCTMIFVLGYLIYRRQEKVSALLVGIAFGMFGLSHFSILTGLAFPEVTLVLLRICGYILVAAGLWLLLPESAGIKNHPFLQG